MPGKKPRIAKGKEKAISSENAAQHQILQASFKNIDLTRLAGKRICYGVSTNDDNENHTGEKYKATSDLLGSIQNAEITNFIACELQRFCAEFAINEQINTEEASHLAREKGDRWICENLDSNAKVLRWFNFDNSSNDTEATLFRKSLGQIYFLYLLAELKVKNTETADAVILEDITDEKLTIILDEVKRYINTFKPSEEEIYKHTEEILNNHNVVINEFDINLFKPSKMLRDIRIDKTINAITLLSKLVGLNVNLEDIISLDILLVNNAAKQLHELAEEGNLIINFIAGLRTINFLYKYFEDNIPDYKKTSKKLIKKENNFEHKIRSLEDKKDHLSNDLKSYNESISKLNLAINLMKSQENIGSPNNELIKYENNLEVLRSYLTSTEQDFNKVNHELFNLTIEFNRFKSETLNIFKRIFSEKLAEFPFARILQYSCDFALHDIAMIQTLAASEKFDALVYPLRQDKAYLDLFNFIRKLLEKYPDFELIDIIFNKVKQKEAIKAREEIAGLSSLDNTDTATTLARQAKSVVVTEKDINQNQNFLNVPAMFFKQLTPTRNQESSSKAVRYADEAFIPNEVRLQRIKPTEIKNVNNFDQTASKFLELFIKKKVDKYTHTPSFQALIEEIYQLIQLSDDLFADPSLAIQILSYSIGQRAEEVMTQRKQLSPEDDNNHLPSLHVSAGS